MNISELLRIREIILICIEIKILPVPSELSLIKQVLFLFLTG